MVNIKAQSGDSDQKPDNIHDENLLEKLERLQAVSNVTSMLGATLDTDKLLPNLVSVVDNLVECSRSLVLVLDEEEVGLKLGAMTKDAASFVIDAETTKRLKNATLGTYSAGSDPIVGAWLRGEPFSAAGQTELTGSIFQRFAEIINLQSFFSVPLRSGERLIGVIIVENNADKSTTPLDREILQTTAPIIAVALENARIHGKTVQKLNLSMYEMNLLHQVDRELNNTIALDTVFSMTLDWAMRFTNSNIASLMLYNERQDRMWVVAQIGFEVANDQIDYLRGSNSIEGRVARTGRAEIVPDVSLDVEYVGITHNTQSKMVVPVTREDRVVAIISLENKRLNAFTDDHMNFVEKLSARAAVAIDNARLYTETVREREKLSHILSNIADVVIVVDPADNVMLANEMAIAVMRLNPDNSHVDQRFSDVFDGSPLVNIFQKAKESGQAMIEEMALPGNKTYHVNLKRLEGIGWIIVMQDITPFKEMDQLKSELVATVSHDLKQPLTAMIGYLDLLDMHRKFDDMGLNFIAMIERSVRNMRNLIDDLLDLANIESGVKLKLEAVQINEVIAECIDSVKPNADSKGMAIEVDMPEQLPRVLGDRRRLHQVFINLISNAVKYTQPTGSVKVRAERRGLSIHFAIQDNGIGITAEDQAHVFERFYRVRRPETESIEGTGLGLAIVKKLVEAHKGKIGLESHLGEGTTFYLTLPMDESDLT